MQRQLERARPNRPKPRSSVGELLAAWLIFLWGVGSGGLFLPYALLNSGEKHFTFPLPILIFDALILLQAALCSFSGLCVLLRQRVTAKYGLIAVALCFLGIGAMNVWLAKSMLDAGVLLWSAIALTLTTLFFMLGRWIGQLEENGKEL